MIQTCDFDVAVLDWHLGWADGTSLMKYIKARCPARPVVMFTGVAQQEEAVEAMKAGLDDFLLKSPSSIARLPGMVRSVLEFSEHRKAERETERLAVVTRLTTAAAHEIFQPVNALSNLLYLLSSTEAKEQNELVQIATAELRRIQEIINRTLAFSQEAPQRVDVFLPHLINDVLSSYRPRLEYAGVNVEKCYDHTNSLKLFPQEIRHLVSNLLSNAIDVVPRGGRILIRVRSSRDWRDMARHGIRLSIADNGPGMSAEIRQKLFQPFFTTKGERGTGLGLWVSRGIVRKHQGTISVRSSTRPDRSGTCFSVFLPYEAAETCKAA
jgi:signal transduction histidine kinase